MSGAVGQEISRVGGPAKVTGAACYSGEITLPGLAHAQIVGAAIASGRITAINTAEAKRALTHHTMPKVNHVLPHLPPGRAAEA